MNLDLLEQLQTSTMQLGLAMCCDCAIGIHYLNQFSLHVGLEISLLEQLPNYVSWALGDAARSFQEPTDVLLKCCRVQHKQLGNAEQVGCEHELDAGHNY